MHDFPTILGLLLLAVMVLLYAPIFLGVLAYDRHQLRRRHHDHLIPATPRSARR